MINTPMSAGGDEYLIVVHYVNVNKRSPEFFTRHGSVVKLLRLEFTSLDTLLHQEALIELLRFSTYIQDRMNSVEGAQRKKEVESSRPRPIRLTSIQEETSGFFKEQLQKQRSRPSGRRKRQAVECVDLKVNAKIDSINLKISTAARDITAFYIEGISASFLSKSSYSQVNADLASISIKNLNPTSIYRDIVAVESAESLQIETVMYNIEQWEMDKNNMSVKVTMGCYRIVFLNAFVTSIMNFLNNFQTAQKAIKDASAAAAVAARTNIKDVQESASRIELSVRIKAPVIYVPMNSKNEHSLMLDMGNLMICNVLKKLEVMNEETGECPMVDEIKIELQNLKLSRVRLNVEKFTSENEVLLLEPVTFTLLMKRNLSTAWFTVVPDIDMSGRLNKINLLLSKEDYATILKVLEQNLSETFEDSKRVQALPSTAKSEAGNEELQIQSGYRYEIDASREVPSSVGAQERHAHTSIKFEFIMDSLVINLFTGGSKLLQSQTSPLHLPEHGLARFTLAHFAVKGRVFADGLLATSILLMNCTLDDTRQSREGSLVRIMEGLGSGAPVSSGSNEDHFDERTKYNARSMLDVTVRQSPNDTFADVRVFSFSIIVSLDYLMKIKDFFDVDTASKTVVTSASRNESVMPRKKKEAMQQQSVTAAQSPKMVTVNLHVEKPDIILLEDMDDINSNCIVLNTELLLKIRIMGEHQVIAGSIKDLSLLTGIYNPAKRADWIYQVLRPCSISVAGSTPEGKGLHLEVCCTDVHISVSPGVIEILNKVVHTVTRKEEENKEIVKPEPNYEGLWIVTPFDENNYWFLKTEVAMEALEEFTYPEDEIAAAAMAAAAYKPELAIVSAPTILFTLEAGIGNKTLPMLLLHVGFQSNVNDWSTKSMSVDCTMSVIMAYYNSRLALWEPLIEPIESFDNGKRVSTPWELKTKIQFNDITLDSRGASTLSPSESEPEELHQSTQMSIDFTSSDNLEITVTKTCLDVLKQLGHSFSSAMEASGKGPTRKVAPYVLKNETGLAIVLDLEHSLFKVITRRN